MPSENASPQAQKNENDANPVDEFIEGMKRANVKRTYDVFELLLAQVLTQATHDLKQVNTVGLQVIQNATENANGLAKRMINAADLATNKQWNLEPSEGAAETTVLRAVTIDDTSLKAIGAVVAVAVADALSKND